MKVYRDLDSIPKINNAVVTIGSYDGLHNGHRTILKNVAELARACNGESVVITFHPHPRQIVFPNDTSLKLLNSLEEKIKLFSEINIDHLFIAPFSIEFSQIHPREYVENFLLKNFQPYRIVIGYDHKFGLNRDGDIRLLREYQNDKLEVIEIEKQMVDNLKISSTKVRDAIQSGYITEANNLLGAPYILIGKVVHGQKIGKTIGFPTANIQVNNPHKLIPSEGIYAVRIEIEESFHDAMLYIGTRPTIDQALEQVIEVNIFDFDLNIYDKEVCIYFIDYIREDRKFENLDELKIALAQDKEKVQALFSSYHYSKAKSKVTIAILNYNGRQHLESNLPSLEESYSYKSEILVIDNNSTDDSVDFIKKWYPEVSYDVLDKNYGFAGGYNKGMEKVDTEYTVILNSDVEVTNGWLDPIIKLMDEDGSIACVQPKIKALENRTHFEYAGAAGGFLDSLAYPFCQGRIFDTIEKDEGQYEEIREVFWASGAAMVIRTKLFKKLGGFDADFFAHMEEIDLCWRAKRAGYKIIYTPLSSVYHLGGGTLQYDSPRKVFLNFRNNLSLLLKNEKKRALFWKFPTRLILDGIAGLKFILEGKVASCVSIIKAHLAIYGSFGKIMTKRKSFNRKLPSIAIGQVNNQGRIKGTIIYKYFLQRKKTFKEI